MSKYFFVGLGIVGALALAVVIATPERATAALPCGNTTCDCDGPIKTTAMVWGHGATCTEAFNDGLAQSRALQSCADGVCWESVIIDAPCWFDGTEYMVDMHTDYRCYECTSQSCGPSPLPDAEME